MAVSLYYAADLFGGGTEVVDNVVRRTLPGALAIEPMARSDKEGDGSRGETRLYIGAFVSHEERASQAGPQHPRGSFEKSDLRFPARAGVLGQVRAVINPIHGRTFVREELFHASIDRAERLERTIPAAHDGLVADNDNRTSGQVQHSNPFGGPGSNSMPSTEAR